MDYDQYKLLIHLFLLVIRHNVCTVVLCRHKAVPPALLRVKCFMFYT